MSLQEGLPEAAECQISVQILKIIKNYIFFSKKCNFQIQQDSAVKMTRLEGQPEAAECQISLQILKKHKMCIFLQNMQCSNSTRQRS